MYLTLSFTLVVAVGLYILKSLYCDFRCWYTPLLAVAVIHPEPLSHDDPDPCKHPLAYPGDKLPTRNLHAAVVDAESDAWYCGMLHATILLRAYKIEF
jgi:hypothetical protein